MELSPRLYRWFVRPKFFTNLYITRNIQSRFDFQNKHVLDFGCGVGSNSRMCDESHYIGVDVDPQRVAYAAQLQPGYKFAVPDGNTLPVPDQSVDFIMIVAVLHHIPSADLLGYFKEFQRVLRPYGKILVMEPCFMKNTKLSNWFMSIFDKGKYIRNEAGYTRLFHQAGFKTEKLKQFKKLFFYNELFFTASKEW